MRWPDHTPRAHSSHDMRAIVIIPVGVVGARPVCLSVISEWVAVHLVAWHNRDHDDGLAAEREGSIL
jgi:hypothetical protein